MTANDRREDPKGLEVGSFEVASLGLVEVGEGRIVTVDVIGLPDGDGQLVYLPRIFDHWDSFDVNVAANSRDVVISDDERGAIIHCLSDLRMPPLVAVWAVLGEKDRDLTKYEGKGLEDKKTPVVVGVVGRAGMGKSTVAAMIARRHGGKVVNMALFNELGAEEYVQELERKGVKVGDINNALKVLNDLREGDKGRTREMVTLRSRLDRLLTLFEGGNRPELLILDMPGLPRDGAEDRNLQITDMLARYSVIAFWLDEDLDYRARLEQARDAWGSQQNDIIGEAGWWDEVFKMAVCPVNNKLLVGG